MENQQSRLFELKDELEQAESAANQKDQELSKVKEELQEAKRPS